MVSKTSLEFVVPVYNESECIDEFLRRFLAIRERAEALEISAIFVNDGSRDDSLEKLEAYAKQHPFIRVISLSRNFGHQIAVTAGLDMASADYVCVIDADLQDPPELVLEMYAEMRRQKVNVLYAQRRQRQGDGPIKKLSAAAFYRVLRRLTSVDIPADTGDFRLIDAKVVQALRTARERHRFLRGLIPWLGFKAAPFLYDRDARFAGVTKYPLRRMLRLAADAIFAFSNRPLRISSYVGLGVAGSGLLLLIYIIGMRLFTNEVVPGLTVLLVSVMMVGGFQILMLGLIGEYLGRVFEEVKRRPLYVVDVVLNGDKPSSSGNDAPL